MTGLINLLETVQLLEQFSELKHQVGFLCETPIYYELCCQQAKNSVRAMDGEHKILHKQFQFEFLAARISSASCSTLMA